MYSGLKYPITDEADDIARNSSVYFGEDNAGIIRYIGRTDRLPDMRIGEHLLDPEKMGLTFRVFPQFNQNLTTLQSKIIEQQLIDKFGISINRSGVLLGGQLLNKINSIGLTNPLRLKFPIYFNF